MTKKNLTLILFVLLLGGLSVYLNRDRFRADTIQIGERWMEPRGGTVPRGQKPPDKILLFPLDRKVELTSVKVLLLADALTNKYPHPVWELTTTSNSIPVKEIVYGRSIRGMHPKVKGAVADPLQPDADYRLIIEAGSQKATRDFHGSPRTP
jgi:hypothetical protein